MVQSDHTRRVNSLQILTSSLWAFPDLTGIRLSVKLMHPGLLILVKVTATETMGADVLRRSPSGR